jgi:hypothetical protein
MSSSPSTEYSEQVVRTIQHTTDKVEISKVNRTQKHSTYHTEGRYCNSSHSGYSGAKSLMFPHGFGALVIILFKVPGKLGFSD